jgi:hypothetical protein
MGFFRLQEEKLAARLLQWQYEKAGQPLPKPAQIKRQAAILVDDAHRIAKKRGGNVMSILKEMVDDMRKS